MTPAELAERGIRIKPLVWTHEVRHMWSSGWYAITLYSGMTEPFKLEHRHTSQVTYHRSLATAQAAAEADHAARICAQLEVME